MQAEPGVTVSLHDGVAFFHWHTAPLGCNRNRGLANLVEQQLIYVVCGEAVFGGQALE
jgi:hypothetical protein